MGTTGTAKFVEIFGSKIHYLDAGKGAPIVFLHGVPASSYIWRNIIPPLSIKARCIAPDLIGMGKSDKPDIAYSLSDHIKYIEEFITKLNLSNITLVLHGLGSAIGFAYAIKNPDNVKAIAFYEAHLATGDNSPPLSLLLHDIIHNLAKHPEKLHDAVIKDNYFLEKILPLNLFHKLSETEMHEYKKPFMEPEHRKPLLSYLKELSGMGQQILEHSKFLQKTLIPKLMMYVNPGFITTMDSVEWYRDNIPNLQIADLEEGMHLAQETNPNLFGQILYDWYTKKVAI